MLPTPELVKSYIAAGLNCSHLEVSGDGAHFEAVIVSDAFAGKRVRDDHCFEMRAVAADFKVRTIQPGSDITFN